MLIHSLEDMELRVGKAHGAMSSHRFDLSIHRTPLAAFFFLEWLGLLELSFFNHEVDEVLCLLDILSQARFHLSPDNWCWDLDLEGSGLYSFLMVFFFGGGGGSGEC